jgi:chromosome segregation ATPase
LRFSDATKRFAELKRSGVQTQSAEQILTKLHADVKELNDRREGVDRLINEREAHLEKLQSWDNTDRITTDEDVRMKREQLQDLQESCKSLSERLEGVMNANTGLIMFKAAKSSALTKYRDRENEVERLSEELRRLNKQTEDKEADLKSKGGTSGKIGKRDLKKYGAVVREKIEGYKKMREELAALRAELVILQSTEHTLRSRHSNLDDFLSEMERQKGVEVTFRFHYCCEMI